MLPKPRLNESLEQFEVMKQDIFNTDFIKASKTVWTLDYNYSTKAKIDDNLCVFRAIAASQLNTYKGLESKTLELFRLYIHGTQQNVTDFTGIELTDFPNIEKYCSCAIRVFSAEQDVNNQIQGELLYRSESLHLNLQTKFIDLLLIDNHTCLIRDLNSFFKQFKCIKCDQYFPRLCQLSKHSKTCSEQTSHSFPGGKYKPNSTFFESLETVFNVCVPLEKRFCKSFVTFDFEAILRKKPNDDQRDTLGNDTNQDDCFIKTKKLEFTHQHVPVSVSIHQNITTEIPCSKWLVEKDPTVLIDKFVDYLIDLSLKNSLIQRQKFLPHLEQIDDMLLELEPDSVGDDTEQVDDDDDDDEVVAHNTGITLSFTQQRLLRLLKQLKFQFLQYIDQLPIVGFNSGFYDLNLIKPHLLKSLQRFVTLSSIKCIKRNARFLLLSTPNLRFIDCSHFVAAGTSLDKFLKAYGSEVNKFFFPYEHLTSFDVLSETFLPPYESFYSSLKNENVLETEINAFLQSGGSLDDSDRPKTGLENYENIKHTWQREGFTAMMDYLQYYNNLDVYPLHKAVKKMVDFYEQHSIDLLKETLTLSGAANKILHRSNKGEGIFLFNFKNKDLYQKVRDNVVGGPSIVFSRYEKVNETSIDDVKVKSIVGYDANALYLSGIGGNMPTGPLTRYEWKENCLIAEKKQTFKS